MNLYDATIPIFTKMLHNAAGWLDTATAFATAKKFAPDLFMQMRLAPDMYPFVQQIRSACDTAKFAAGKMTGKEFPAHPDTETTIDELRARIRSCVAYLEGFSREDFVASEDRSCSHQWMGGKTMRAGDYLDHFVLPNFHFHLTMGYAILRHNGVDVGKLAYLGSLPFNS
jgi:uncharacterized protein